MCLAIPVSIRNIEGSNGTVEVSGVKRIISLRLTPEAKVGDYVLLHAGYAIGIVDEEDAAETLKLFEAMSALSGGNESSKEFI
jgi:hydrogenase expression/formation protein HypC